MQLQVALVLCFSILFTLTSSLPFSQEWLTFMDFVNEHNKPYKNDSEVSMRKFRVFQQSLDRHKHLNAREAELKGTAVYGVNKFSDLTPEEFQSLYLSPLKPDGQQLRKSTIPDNVLKRVNDVPTKFDWRNWNNLNVISSINNQQYCGSCWAFSVIETIESALAIETKSKPQKLSVQQLISCEYVYGELEGCSGGRIIYAMQRLQDQSTVIESDEKYPFTSSDGSTGYCRDESPTVGVVVEEFIQDHDINEKLNMTMLVSSVSPTSNAVNAIMWQDYKEGIIQHHCSGDSNYLDHAIQVVGYSLESDPIPYWIIRNTWGSDWGENGYLRISLGQNTCGIATEVAAVSKVTVKN